MQNENNIYSLLMSNKEWLQKYGLQGCNINLRSLATEVRNRSVNPEKRLPVSEVRYPGIDANQDRLNQQYQKEKDEPPVAMQVQIVRELIYKRLAWTTTSSRKIFGILPGDCVILMLAVSTSNILAFYHFIEDVISLLVEQIATKKYFNIISYTDEGERTFQSTITPVTNGSLAEARAWLQHLPRPSRGVSIQPSLVFFEDEKLGEDSSTKVTVCWYDTGEEADSEVLKYVRVHWYKSVAAIVKLENNNLPLATEVHPRKTLNGDFQHTRDGDVFESDEVKLLVEEIRDCGDILRVLKQAGSLQEKTTASESDIVCETKPPFGAEVKHWLKGVSTTSSSRLSRDTKYIASKVSDFSDH
ncbi:uncharacterized protein LOC143228463 [Tachypleus tridentatus]|uniref:uncharacterized protein LOC143228463 n=1 Tax=Tachypleus tridentatus TaxID=6853 RepID=UPI003FD28135